MELRLKYGEGMAQAEFPDFFSTKIKEKSGRFSGLERWGLLRRSSLPAGLQAERQLVELHPKHIATLQKPEDILNQALDKPLGCHPFNRVFRSARNVLIVMPDPAEATGAEHYLPRLRERLNSLHVPDEEIRILVAKRAEALMPQNISAPPLSDFVDKKVRVFWHDPADHKALEYVGLTRRGTPVFVNRLLLEADCVLICGTVTHHPFAGYGGGPRLIVPGCAGEETIHRHFSQAIDTEGPEEGRMPNVHARCRDGVIEGNPLQEDSREAFRCVTTNFLLHTVLNDQRQIVGAVAGEPLQAFAAGCKALDNMFAAPVALRSSFSLLTREAGAHLVMVGCGGAPNDRDFRAAYAALHRAAQITQPGGVIIFVAECRDGLGAPALSQFLQAGARGELEKEIGENLISPVHRVTHFPARHAGHLLHRWFYQNEIEALIALSLPPTAAAQRVIAVTALQPELSKRLGFIPAPTLSEALVLAKTYLPDFARLGRADRFSAILISNGTLLVPYLN